MATRCSVREPDPFQGTIHEQEAQEAEGLVGEDHELDQLLLEVATVGRPADSAQRVADEVVRLRSRDTVIDAARHFMAANLVAERLGQRCCSAIPSSVETYDQAAMFALDALQTLRDCLAAERATRRSRR